MISCRKCFQEKEEKAFLAGRRTCNACRYAQDKANNSERISAESKKRRLKESLERKDEEHIAKYVLQDSKRSDQKFNRENDLSLEFCQEMLKGPCQYCGNFSLRMTLDRVDNTLGHIQSNLVCSCIRCNYARGAMPYQAWVLLIPGLKQANKDGLFGDWLGI